MYGIFRKWFKRGEESGSRDDAEAEKASDQTQRDRFRIGRDYTLFLPFGYVTFSPWFEDWFQEIYGKVRDRTVVTEDRCYTLYRLCQHSLNLEGDFAECGVYKGGTAYVIAYAMKENSHQDRPLHLFDTFQGLPSIADADPAGHKSGMFGDVSVDDVERYLRGFPFAVFHPGLIPDTLDEVKDDRFALVHIDVDLYETVKDCCGFFYDRMTKGGIMIFDNYGFYPYKDTEKRAVDEFFDDKPEIPIPLPTGQCIVIKL